MEENGVALLDTFWYSMSGEYLAGVVNVCTGYGRLSEYNLRPIWILIPQDKMRDCLDRSYMTEINEKAGSLSLRAHKGILGWNGCLISSVFGVTTFETVPNEQEKSLIKMISSGSQHLSTTGADHLGQQMSMVLTWTWHTDQIHIGDLIMMDYSWDLEQESVL